MIARKVKKASASTRKPRARQGILQQKQTGLWSQGVSIEQVLHKQLQGSQAYSQCSVQLRIYRCIHVQIFRKACEATTFRFTISSTTMTLHNHCFKLVHEHVYIVTNNAAVSVGILRVRNNEVHYIAQWWQMKYGKVSSGRVKNILV